MELLSKSAETVRRLLSAEKRGAMIKMMLLGAALMLLSHMAAKQETVGKVDAVSKDSYCAETEQKLERILSRIEGVGQAQVMVTLENGVEYRYAADEKQSGDSVFTYASGSDSPSKVQEKEDREQSYILIGSSGDRRPLVVTELSPRVRGVVVVCDGAKNPIIRQRVSEAVTTALGISSLQVCVIQSAI